MRGCSKALGKRWVVARCHRALSKQVIRFSLSVILSAVARCVYRPSAGSNERSGNGRPLFLRSFCLR